jgi:hypothetical protein
MLQKKAPPGVDAGAVAPGLASDVVHAGKKTSSEAAAAAPAVDGTDGGSSQGGGAGGRIDDWPASSLMSAMGLGGDESAAAESLHGNPTEGAQLEDAASATAGLTTQVQTTLTGKGGGAPVTSELGPTHAQAGEGAGQEMAANSIVAPGGTPAVGAGANDCVPSTASAVVAWSAVDAGASWRADVTSLTLAGRVRINPWPSSPSAMTVPNTPNPVVGGNIDNTAGSSNHWQAAIDDLSNYDTAGGGAGPNWHSTAASTAHEWAHWHQDYVGDAVTSAAGGNWAAVNARIDALMVPKAANATAADARVALTPLVDAEIAAWRTATIRRWNAIIGGTDTPGGGGRGYAAGAAVLATHIAAIRVFKAAQGW